MAWWIGLVVSLVLAVISYVLTPKPKVVRPDFARDLENPTAEAGRPMPVVFGTVLLKSPNVLWYGQKATNEYDTWA